MLTLMPERLLLIYLVLHCFCVCAFFLLYCHTADDLQLSMQHDLTINFICFFSRLNLFHLHFLHIYTHIKYQLTCVCNCVKALTRAECT